ncbi:hypothetical protein [Spirosoma oryzicola]|uniref:hypothetical protein n=1 Tax=Spirosoma oryzicola TaxID=2898794 RepID=UPI001E5A09CA|nr:hypothetical protein [Spirosoma oryzicola]UHG94687.1 hypothetical protein LQ777_29255 [Spirosoma oryzicola]
MSLSDRTRMQVVIVALVLLAGGSVYKLVVSIRHLNDPAPIATPDQMIKPMEKLFQQSSNNQTSYKQAKRYEMRKLDSLAKLYDNYHKTSPQ